MARLLGHLARGLAIILHRVGSVFSILARLSEGVLPALLSPADLVRLTRDEYLHDYASNVQALDLAALDAADTSLDTWEREVFDRYGLQRGRILVLGAGTGRESIALAQRGLSVVGMDASLSALQAARRLAGRRGVSIRWHQADYRALPYKSGCFDYAMLSSAMYSAIAGRTERQRWLRELSHAVVRDGLIILSFLPALRAPTRTQVLCGRLNRFLVALPGTNKAYQPGDDFTSTHFLHTFRDEKEIREELAETGAIIREVVWNRCYAVVTFLS